MGEIDKIVDKHRGERGDLIAILEDIQAKYSYLPEAALREVAESTNRSLTDVYGVATFYRWFSLKPRGRHLLTCCVGTACHVRGAPRVVDELRHQLAVEPGNTTPDGEFTLETQNCLGGCALGTIVVADGHYFSKVEPRKVGDILGQARDGLNGAATTDQRAFPVQVSCTRCNRSLMNPRHRIDGLPSIKVNVAFGQKHGWLRLSSLYGSYELQMQHEIPLGEEVNFFCPHCHAELSGAVDCVDCGATMVSLIVKGGGTVEFCSRRGCKNHMLDLNGINHRLAHPPSVAAPRPSAIPSEAGDGVTGQASAGT